MLEYSVFLFKDSILRSDVIHLRARINNLA